MKQYPHCIEALFYRPVCITAEKHTALCRVLESRMAQPLPDETGMEPDPEDALPEIDTSSSVRVIPVHGVLIAHASDIPASSCGCGLDTIGSLIDVVSNDPSVETIVFDFRSPGGGVVGIPEMARKIARINKNTVAWADYECCSAALWLASQCKSFFCTPSANIGSVGVWCAYLDISRQMAMDGQNMQAISAGKYKLLGAYWKPLSDEEKAMVQADVDEIYSMFLNDMLLKREIPKKYMQGQGFGGSQAVEIGMADGTYDELQELMDDIME